MESSRVYERTTFVRRVSLDLIGLPPSFKETARFSGIHARRASEFFDAVLIGQCHDLVAVAGKTGTAKKDQSESIRTFSGPLTLTLRMSSAK